MVNLVVTDGQTIIGQYGDLFIKDRRGCISVSTTCRAAVNGENDTCDVLRKIASEERNYLCTIVRLANPF